MVETDLLLKDTFVLILFFTLGDELAWLFDSELGETDTLIELNS